MKKLIALILALCMCAAMSVTAFAASPISSVGGSDNHDVNGIYVAGQPSETVYSVDISWGAMSFTYTDASVGTWDPSTHDYVGGTAATWSWTDNANEITVTNHSNAAIDVKLSFESAAAGISGGFYTTTRGTTPVAENKLSLATAEGAAPSSAPSANAYFQVTGGAIAASAKIGTVIVELADHIQEVPGAGA